MEQNQKRTVLSNDGNKKQKKKSWFFGPHENQGRAACY